MKSVLVSGIQPTGRLHIGNYLGALKHFVELQNSGTYRCYFFIADLHSLTKQFEPRTRYKQVLEFTADFIAAGLSPKKSVLFQQSQVPAHTELAWILSTITPLGELYRMTQFKDKAAQHLISHSNIEQFQPRTGPNVGLLTYPLLMAADIILYDAKYVPVGDDQLQHLELTRTLVRKFNSKFFKAFVEPQPLLTATPRVMSLKNPMKKMSKSDPDGCLFLDDTPQVIKKKLMRAVTDSETEVRYDPNRKPGVSNLLEIHSALSGIAIPKLEKHFIGRGYSALKAETAKFVEEYFAEFRMRKATLLKKSATLKMLLGIGSRKARRVAEKKMIQVKKWIGLAT